MVVLQTRFTISIKQSVKFVGICYIIALHWPKHVPTIWHFWACGMSQWWYSMQPLLLGQLSSKDKGPFARLAGTLIEYLHGFQETLCWSKPLSNPLRMHNVTLSWAAVLKFSLKILQRLGNQVYLSFRKQLQQESCDCCSHWRSKI